MVLQSVPKWNRLQLERRKQLSVGPPGGGFQIDWLFLFFISRKSVAKAIHAYNTFRPHASIG
ncbi:transposase [Dyadobacter chenwenxiniae]|uniref:Transposase n=1 Tax=Dyadobacter chenwenxiniae TaxID=2906456 RepID=A0A9X1PQ37_9BACT|nr:transposase [Dyadobacter chenwenxiniae]MCF0064415.1 transposase [Dyadobacter chenwenxiniae]UON82379.1 transposase [Dyadobacter chenwenxiniae]